MGLPRGEAHVRFSSRADGDLRVTAASDQLAARRSAFVDRRWVSMTQVHGATVRVVDGSVFDGPGVDGSVTEPLEGDALVTEHVGLVLSVNVADCAPVALVSPQGVVGAVHAGWRGIQAGVIEATVETMRSLGAHEISAWLGPCIHPECYEFGTNELRELIGRFGPGVGAYTRSGQPALDVPMAVALALGRAGVELVGAAGMCTACDPRRFYSFRARRDEGRHALAVWMDGDGG